MLRLSILLTGLVAPFALQAQSAFPIDLRQGIMAGEPSPDSVILQSRLTSASRWVDPALSFVVGARGEARFEIADNEAFRDSRFTPWLEARPEWDFIVKHLIRDLRPGARYYYRLHYGPSREETRTSQTATFRTLAGERAEAPYSFAVVTGMAYSKFHWTGSGGEDPVTGAPAYPPYSGPDKELGYPGLKSIVDRGVDFFVATGDNVYYDTPRVGRAETLQQMRAKHQRQYSQQRFLDMFAAIGTYWMKDDHDYRFDDGDPYNLFGAQPGLLVDERQPSDYYDRVNRHPWVSGSGDMPSHEMGVRMFREQLPVVDLDDPKGETYRTLRVSKSLQIWFVEGRDYRSPNDMPDGPRKSIWGAEQKAWLQRTLIGSDAKYKMLISPTPMVGPDSASKRDNHVNPTGFRHEGDEFFRWLADNGFDPKKFAIVCGDRHWQYHAIHPSGFEEFSTGALVDANAVPGIKPGARGSSDPEGLVKHLHFNEIPTGGFLEMTFEPAPGGSKLHFRFYNDRGEPLYATELGGPR